MAELGVTAAVEELVVGWEKGLDAGGGGWGRGGGRRIGEGWVEGERTEGKGERTEGAGEEKWGKSKSRVLTVTVAKDAPGAASVAPTAERPRIAVVSPIDVT